MASGGGENEAAQGKDLSNSTTTDTDILQPVVNFSQNACRSRYQSLLDGTAKPTPESIENPDILTQARIQSRIDKEAEIQRKGPISLEQNNIEKSGWTSKSSNFKQLAE